MINIVTNKQLDIMLTSTNKALAEVIKTATPLELKNISQNIAQSKDLNSIISTLLKQSATDSSSDKALLNLVKNNPTLKNLGPIGDTIKDLLVTLKADEKMLPAQNRLKSFLVDIKDITQPILKQKIENSGVFLESKLKNVQNPQVELKTVLESLSKTLDKSKIFNVTVLSENIKELLSAKPLGEASNKALTQTPLLDKDSLVEKKAILEVIKKLETILPKLTEHIKNMDVINKPNFRTTLAKLAHLIEPKMLQEENFQLPKLKETLVQVTVQLPQSKIVETKSILDSLVKIITLLKTTPTLDTLIEKKVPQEIKANIDNLKQIINKADPIYSKEVASHLQKLTYMTSPTQLQTQHNVKEIINNDFKAILNLASDEVTKLDHPNKQEILKQIDKLTLQIDYSQLLSHLSNASSLYIPFAWDQMKEGHINIHKDSDDKFYVDIDLKLKEYGELNLKLTMYDKNQLNLHIYSNSSLLKKKIKENLSSLRSALIDNNITPREMRLFDIKEKKAPSPYDTGADNINMGFEVKG
ncbi:MAG: flagellar hook-length control protein FliK [Sulfurimonas sp.]